MTSSGPAEKATTKPHGEPEAQPGGAVPGDEQELRQQIEQTREQLGETVEQLAAKTDVTGRARAKAAQVTGRVKGGTAQVRAKGGTQVGSKSSQVAAQAATARQKAAAAASTATAQLRARSAPVLEKAPEPLRRTVVKGASAAKQRPLPLAVTAAAVITGCLALRWWRKR